MDHGPTPVRLEVEIDYEQVDVDRITNEGGTTLAAVAKELVYAAPGFDTVDEVLTEMKVVKSPAAADEWVEVRTGQPAEELDLIPDDAVVFAAWEHRQRAETVTIYRTPEKGSWTTITQDDMTRVKAGPVAVDIAKAAATRLRE